MLTKRIIPCLDIRNRKVTKGVRFQHNVELGDPVEMAARYYEQGCDELVFYDITASAERRPIDIEMVRAVARAVRIPFAVGGGMPSSTASRTAASSTSFTATIRLRPTSRASSERRTMPMRASPRSWGGAAW